MKARRCKTILAATEQVFSHPIGKGSHIMTQIGEKKTCGLAVFAVFLGFAMVGNIVATESISSDGEARMLVTISRLRQDLNMERSGSFAICMRAAVEGALNCTSTNTSEIHLLALSDDAERSFELFRNGSSRPDVSEQLEQSYHTANETLFTDLRTAWQVFAAWQKLFWNVNITLLQLRLAFVQSVIFPLCDAAFPMRQCLSICRETCSELSVAGKLLSTLIDTPLLHSYLSLLNNKCRSGESEHQSQECTSLAPAPAKESGCLDEVQRKIVSVNRTSTHSANGLRVGMYCLRTACSYPLRQTSHSHRWLGGIQSKLRLIHNATVHTLRRYNFSFRDFDGSLISCGRDCVTIGMTRADEKLSRLLVGSFAVLVLASITFSIVVFWYNAQRFARFPIQRVACLLSVSGGMALFCYLPSLDFDRKIFCHDDDTLRLSEPDLDWSGACAFVGWWNLFSSLLACCFTMALAHSWMQLMKRLRKIRSDPCKHVGWRKYKMDVVYSCLGVPFAAGISIAVLVQRGFDGIPALGTCLPSMERDFHVKYLITFACVTLATSFIFLSLGLRHLSAHRPGLKPIARWLLRRHSSDASKNGRNFVAIARIYRRKKRVDRLAWRMFLLVVTLLVTLPTFVLQVIYLESKTGEWRRQTSEHISCTLFSCVPNQKCPPLPNVPFLHAVLPLLVGELALFVSTLWAYSQKAYRRIPLVARFRRRWRRRLLIDSPPITNVDPRPISENLKVETTELLHALQMEDDVQR